jgi:catechol 2,3-dioxygenase-like lactoylglutathione lyase family enzyme
MIDHVTIKVSDLEKSRKFYEAAFVPLGYKVSFGKPSHFWAFDIGNGLFEIAQYQGETPLTPCHVAFRAQEHEQVKSFYNAALRAGGKDFGPPGPRPQYTKNYYACFILDTDGHNIEVMFDK